jgi:hypothetical protein
MSCPGDTRVTCGARLLSQPVQEPAGRVTVLPRPGHGPVVFVPFMWPRRPQVNYFA